MRVDRITAKDRLHGYLSRDPIRAAYLIGGLDPVYDDYCEWYGLSEGEEIRALLLVYRGLSLPGVFTLGATDDVGQLIHGCGSELPRRFYAHLLEGHEIPLARHYRVDRLRRMLRKAVERDGFRPASSTEGVRQVTHADTADIIELYQFYPDNFFEPYQLESGYYYCVREDGRLVSIAGVHVVSEQYDVASIGNIVTHPDYRGRGLSTRCTGKLLDELFQRVGLVVLNVPESNEAARATFRKLGFRNYNVYLEGHCEIS